VSVKTKHPPVIVAGMHRSGTSLVASVLSALSIDLGQELLPADSNNVRGYFEDTDFLRLQRTILSECCAANDGGHPDWGWTESESLDKSCFKRFLPEASALLARQSERSTPWGWKDPRTALLLDFWDGLLDDARYVFVYRYPWDVADSMQRLGAETFLRNPEYGYRIWEFYNRHIRDFYVKHSGRCLLVSANALGGKLAEFTRLIGSKLGIPVAGAELEQIYQPDLLKTTGGCDPLIDLVAAVWPGCTDLLSELDELADISAAGLWQAGPVHSKLERPDSTAEGDPIDVSVITPCYNQGVLLVEAVASVERYAPPGCELIIVNDGSQDPRTLEILEVLKHCGYFIVDQQNLGLPAARNRAIEMARGRYILPLDDDNRIRASFIEDAKRVLDSSPDVGVVYGDRYDFGLRSGAQQVAGFDQILILAGNYIDACAIFRRQVWQDCNGYDLGMPANEDWELWVHAGERGWGFHHLPYVTFDYRLRPNSLIAKFQSVPAFHALRNEILLRHPRSHVRLLCVELAAEREHSHLVSSKLTAEQDRGQVLSATLAAEQERAQVLSATLAAELTAAEEERARVSAELATSGRLAHSLSESLAEAGKQIAAVTAMAAVTERQLAAVTAEAADRGTRLAAVTAEAADRERRLLAVTGQVADRERELAAIKRSLGWRLMGLYGRVKFPYLLPLYKVYGLLKYRLIGRSLEQETPATEPLPEARKASQAAGPVKTAKPEEKPEALLHLAATDETRGEGFN
jgi:hypothetical protein